MKSSPAANNEFGVWSVVLRFAKNNAPQRYRHFNFYIKEHFFPIFLCLAVQRIHTVIVCSIRSRNIVINIPSLLQLLPYKSSTESPCFAPTYPAVTNQLLDSTPSSCLQQASPPPPNSPTTVPSRAILHHLRPSTKPNFLKQPIASLPRKGTINPWLWRSTIHIKQAIEGNMQRIYWRFSQTDIEG